MAAPDIDTSPRPLAGLRVVDLTHARAGPACVRHLADWGAEVISVQRPNSAGDNLIGDRSGSDYQNLHRNKRVISLNLKTPAGHAVFLKLAGQADVLIENMRAPVKRKLKIAWEDLSAINPRLVYGSISGFGQTGPYEARAAVDQIAQGMGGLMAVTGEPGRGPMRAGIAVSDMASGTLLALAVMMALYERERTGVGRWVHTSLLESMIYMMDFQAARWLVDGDVPGQVANGHPTVAATDAFPTSDGYVNIAASTPDNFRSLCDVLGHPEWPERSGWENQAERRRNRYDVQAAIAAVTKTRATAHWVSALEPLGVSCGPIYKMDQVFADPQVRHLGVAAPVKRPNGDDLFLVNSPLNMEGVTKSIGDAARLSPSDTADVLGELGYGAAAIEALRAEGAI